ncbi:MULTISPECIES: hypothetical protein [Microvirgula]|uniref:hypothetical protein n=1 Tax=Microvirgula TaxID=57479 RepID=UPI00048E48A9|nr:MULTISPECIES: hypothetical protein [Microvirgula]RAS12943.1 hypothetical protein DFO50_1165 [Microvirgula sp. AG722]
MPRLLAVMLSTLAATVDANGLVLPLVPQPAPLVQGMPGDGDAAVPDDGAARNGRQVDRRVERNPRRVERDGRRLRRPSERSDSPPAVPASPLPVDERGGY